MNVLEHIKAHRLVAISRQVYSEDLLKAVEQVLEGGIAILEITFDQADPANLTLTPDSIRAVKARFGERICVGAGTVMTVAQAEAAKAAGADFALAPNTDVEVIRRMKELGLVAVPGAFTPSEIAAAYAAGADIVKIFPASSLGTAYLDAIRGPINHIPLMAVGGVTPENVRSFFEHGCMSAGIGSAIISKKKAAQGDFKSMGEAAAAFVSALNNL